MILFFHFQNKSQIEKLVTDYPAQSPLIILVGHFPHNFRLKFIEMRHNLFTLPHQKIHPNDLGSSFSLMHVFKHTIFLYAYLSAEYMWIYELVFFDSFLISGLHL